MPAERRFPIYNHGGTFRCWATSRGQDAAAQRYCAFCTFRYKSEKVQPPCYMAMCPNPAALPSNRCNVHDPTSPIVRQIDSEHRVKWRAMLDSPLLTSAERVPSNRARVAARVTVLPIDEVVQSIFDTLPQLWRQRLRLASNSVFLLPVSEMEIYAPVERWADSLKGKSIPWEAPKDGATIEMLQSFCSIDWQRFRVEYYLRPATIAHCEYLNVVIIGDLTLTPRTLLRWWAAFEEVANKMPVLAFVPTLRGHIRLGPTEELPSITKKPQPLSVSSLSINTRINHRKPRIPPGPPIRIDLDDEVLSPPIDGSDRDEKHQQPPAMCDVDSPVATFAPPVTTQTHSDASLPPLEADD